MSTNDPLIRLRQARVQAGLNRADMAIFFGFKGPNGRNTVARWEKSEDIPAIAHRPRFMAYLGGPLGLRNDRQRFDEIWHALEKRWSWPAVTDREWIDYVIGEHAQSGTADEPVAIPNSVAPGDREIVPPCPYPGMVPFRLEDAAFFYGRDGEIQRMLQHLRYHQFLFVIGPSGSGKSSLIFAGLLPKLQTSTYFSPESWLVRFLRPGEQPIQVLAQALEGDPLQPDQTITSLLSLFHPAQRLLLIIDQFEEVFTQAGRDEQVRFIGAIQSIRKVANCAILIAMRADFYGELMRSSLWPISNRQRLEIAPLRGTALRQAIQRPAANLGVFLEPGLLERLIADAAEEPGALPAIQETMVLLWGYMQDRRLLISAYDQLGEGTRSGLATALAAKADATLDVLSNIEQIIAWRILARLVQFGEGRPDTRRQQPIDELRSNGDNPNELNEVLYHLVSNRLLTLSGQEDKTAILVDISHEALITHWPTFREWLSQHGKSEQVRRRLEDRADEWIGNDLAASYLLRASHLYEAVRWINSSRASIVGFSDSVVRFVAESQYASTGTNYAPVREYMIARVDMVAIEVDTPLEDAIEHFAKFGHSCMPVYKETIDNIVGFLYAKDILKVLNMANDDVAIKDVMQPPYYVPETRRVDSIIKELYASHISMALAVDDFGGTAGFVTLHDLLEAVIESYEYGDELSL